jgi:5-methylthioadenosine/S-adenosylhomocysteine deaminase
MIKGIVIKGGTVVTMDEDNSIVRGDVLIRDGRIAELGDSISSDADETIDARGCAVLPGFVQTHIHLCQTLFRGAADDLSLIDWLKQRVWPMEAAHTAGSIRASAQLGIAELIKGGTTCALTMETVRYTEEVLRVVEETGFRATVGKCMMDKGDEVPSELRENSRASIDESLALIRKWHGAADGRIRCCFAPRFAISCTRGLLSEVATLAREHGVMIHTHASENKKECEIVESESGQRNIAYLNSLGISGSHVVLAHCIHLDKEEMELLTQTGTNVAHCPSSNLKLGSGLARVAEMLARKIAVSLGADGAACNNRLDMFDEMRLAAMLQANRLGPGALTAHDVVWMATRGGAKTLGLDAEIGSLEPGKKADLILVGRGAPHAGPMSNPYAALVYAARSSDVRTTIVDGRVLVDEGRLTGLDPEDAVARAREQVRQLTLRARLG